MVTPAVEKLQIKEIVGTFIIVIARSAISDEAIANLSNLHCGDCFASLAMTVIFVFQQPVEPPYSYLPR
jgi:hypothetical protein